MCKLVTCNKCGKFTWVGCGQHLLSLFSNKTIDQICLDDPVKLAEMKKYISN